MALYAIPASTPARVAVAPVVLAGPAPRLPALRRLVAVAARGRLVVVTAGPWTYSVVGGRLRRETAGAGQLALHPAGRWLAYDATSNAGVQVSGVFLHRLGAPADARADRRLAPPGLDRDEVWAPDWAPDGSRLAVLARPPRGGAPAVWIVRPDGRSARRVASATATDADLRWSPDGRRLAWLSARRGRTCVRTVPVVRASAAARPGAATPAVAGPHARTLACLPGGPAGLAFATARSLLVGARDAGTGRLWQVDVGGGARALAERLVEPAAGAPLRRAPALALPPLARLRLGPRPLAAPRPAAPGASLRGHPYVGDGGQWYGVTLSGYEDDRWPGYTRRRILADLDAFHRRGMNLVRFTFDWQFLQRRLGGPLDRRYAGGMDTVVREAARRGMAVILDMHDYFKYGSHGVPMCEPGCATIGSPAVPVAAYAAIWRTLARRYGRFPNVQWSLNTEPFDLGAEVLVPAYQAAIDAIRSVTRLGSVIVDPGEWASMEDFQVAEPGLLALHDPAGHLLFDEHAYFDDDQGGDYRRTYRSYAASWAGLGPAYDRIHAPPLRQLEPFLEWLARHHRRGIVGEIGVPGNDRRDGMRDAHARWVAVLSRAYADLARRRQIAAVVYWAGGLWECRPNDNELPASDGSSRGVCRHGRAPQMQVLDRYRWPGLGR